MEYVVGSGPSGVACAAALLKQGRSVHMLDAGIQLEPERAELVRKLGQLTPEQWNPADVERLKDGMDPSVSGVAKKLIYGSDYPYRDVEEHVGVVYEGVGPRASLAVGGLSSAWGSAMLPCLEQDIADWPIKLQQLTPHYRAVLELSGLSARHDDLAEFFPLHTDTPGQLTPSRQAEAILQRLNRNRAKLRQKGIHHGQSRIAVQAARHAGDAGCVYCGLCLYGCPYRYIYNSEYSLKPLEQSGNFTYQSDCIVRAVRETGGGVVVAGYNRITRQPFEHKAERVYLAAGVVPTTGILLRSLAAHDQTVLMSDSQYFLLPVVLGKRVPEVRREKLHALSQIFLELLDPKISPHVVHLQVYTFNDLMAKVLRKTMGPLAGPLEFLARELEGRLLLIQGFIHSSASSKLEVTLRKNSGSDKETLHMKAAINPEARRTIHRIIRKLARHSFQTGFMPLPMMLQIGAPGRSFHAGGTFPMRANPSRFETDVWGRPAGWRRVHAVDSTVFPSIPASTITFSVMANAHRIGTEAPHLEPAG